MREFYEVYCISLILVFFFLEMLRISITFMAARGDAQAHGWQSRSWQRINNGGLRGPRACGLRVSMKLPSMETDMCVSIYSSPACVHTTYVCMCSDLCVHTCVQLLEDQETAWEGEGHLGNERNHSIPCENRGGSFFKRQPYHILSG